MLEFSKAESNKKILKSNIYLFYVPLIYIILKN